MIRGIVAEEFTKDCPRCGLTIPAPTYLIQERPVYDPALGTFRTRLHIGPNDVEYEMHVGGCTL